MAIEDRIPDKFKIHAYHPSTFVYAWKKAYIEKLTDELSKSNIAIRNLEVWFIEDEKITRTIPMYNGDIKVFEHEVKRNEDEQWYDYVDRSIKEVWNKIKEWDLEKTIRPDLTTKIWYYLDFTQEPQ